MLCLHLSRNPSASLLNNFLQPLWPVSRDVFTSLEQDMIRTVGDIKASMKLMDKFYQQLMQEMVHQETLPVLTSGNTKSSEEGFVLSLAVQDFSPQELTVKLLGRKLLVTGAKESKCEDGKGSFSYKCQIFRKEADIPDDIKVDELTCTITNDGQLHIEAPRMVLPAGQERTVPIQLPAVISQERKQSLETNKSAKSS
ncbi:heat shock protein beta-9 [Pelodytes ibericus]